MEIHTAGRLVEFGVNLILDHLFGENEAVTLEKTWWNIDGFIMILIIMQFIKLLKHSGQLILTNRDGMISWNQYLCLLPATCSFKWTSESQVMWAVKEEPHAIHIILIYVIQHWHVLSHVGPKQRTNIWNSGSAIQFRLAGKLLPQWSAYIGSVLRCIPLAKSHSIPWWNKIKEFLGCLVSHMHIHLAQQVSIAATYSLVQSYDS